MASKRRLQDKSILQEMFLPSDSDTSATAIDSDATHESENSSDSDNVIDRLTNHSGLTVPYLDLLHLLLIGLQGVQVGSFWELPNCWYRRQIGTWTRLTSAWPHCLM
jgi:hypothetical protein